MGLNLLVAVGQGAKIPPRLILLKYKGKDIFSTGDNRSSGGESSGSSGGETGPKFPIAFVGKGVTFDTGGLNMKSTGFIEDMYMDMGGCAAVLATLSALPHLKLCRNAIGVLCVAENAVDSQSYYPSSIIKSYKGATVEICNTDAEGRLILADGLAYVQRHYKPSTVVDLATLTGACVIALGEYAAGLFTNDDILRDQFIKSGESVFERAWPLPIFPEHSEELKGTHSDLKNTGKGRYGGACTAAAFLKEFVEPGTKWAHLDIAGPAMTSESRGPIPKGGTGFGVQLLLQWLLQSE